MYESFFSIVYDVFVRRFIAVVYLCFLALESDVCAVNLMSFVEEICDFKL